MEASVEIRKFSIVDVYTDDVMYEVHDFNCRAKMRYVQDRSDISTIRGTDVEDALRDTKETLAADWGGWPADSNFKIHKCTK